MGMKVKKETEPVIRLPDAPSLPTSVRVGGIDWTVRPWNPQAATNTGALGMCDRETCTILIRANLVPQRMAEVLVHEILHAAWDVAGLAWGGDAGISEERIVNALGYQWLQVIRDNPEVFDFVHDALTFGSSPSRPIEVRAA